MRGQVSLGDKSHCFLANNLVALTKICHIHNGFEFVRQVPLRLVPDNPSCQLFVGQVPATGSWDQIKIN